MNMFCLSCKCGVRELLRLSGRLPLLVSAHHRTWQSRLGPSPTMPPSRLPFLFANSFLSRPSLAYPTGIRTLLSATQSAQNSIIRTCSSQRDVIPICVLIIPHSYPAQHTPTPEHRTRPHTSSVPNSLVAARAHVEMQGREQRMPKTASRSHSARR